MEGGATKKGKAKSGKSKQKEEKEENEEMKKKRTRTDIIPRQKRGGSCVQIAGSGNLDQHCCGCRTKKRCIFGFYADQLSAAGVSKDDIIDLFRVCVAKLEEMGLTYEQWKNNNFNFPFTTEGILQQAEVIDTMFYDLVKERALEGNITMLIFACSNLW